jgi:hypothetical protein
MPPQEQAAVLQHHPSQSALGTPKHLTTAGHRFGDRSSDDDITKSAAIEA